VTKACTSVFTDSTSSERRTRLSWRRQKKHFAHTLETYYLQTYYLDQCELHDLLFDTSLQGVPQRDTRPSQHDSTPAGRALCSATPLCCTSQCSC